MADELEVAGAPEGGQEAGQEATQGDQVGQDEGKEQLVPLSVVLSMKEELAALKNTDMLRRAAESQGKAKEPDPVDSIGDDEFLTGKQVKDLIRGLATKIESGQARNEYSDVIREVLPEILTPGLDAALMKIPEAHRLHVVGEMCRAEKAKRQAGGKPANPNAEAERIKKLMANQDKPKSPATAGAGGKASMASVERYATMTDAEFAAHKEKIKRGG